MHFIKLKPVLLTEINTIKAKIYWQEHQPIVYYVFWGKYKEPKTVANNVYL